MYCIVIHNLTFLTTLVILQGGAVPLAAGLKRIRCRRRRVFFLFLPPIALFLWWYRKHYLTRTTLDHFDTHFFVFLFSVPSFEDESKDCAMSQSSRMRAALMPRLPLSSTPFPDFVSFETAGFLFFFQGFCTRNLLFVQL